MTSARDRLVAFRRAQPRPPRLERRTVRVGKLDFAVWLSPPVPGAVPLCCVNGGLIYGHDLLWPALAPLAAARQLVLYDQRGRGETQPPPQPLAARIEDDAEDVGLLRFALGIKQWDVLGHSWGGGIALLAASRDRAGTRRVVTVDAVGPTSAWLPQLHAASLERTAGDDRTFLEHVDRERALDRVDPELYSRYSRALYPAWFADPTLAASFAPPRAISLTGAAVGARLRRDGYDWADRVRALAAPTLVIHGTRDALPTSVADALASLLSKARLTLVPDAGHMPFWEAPAPFFSTVERWLAAENPLDLLPPP